MTKAMIAWVAGIYEGEGCCGIRRSAIRLELTMTDHDIITRFHEAVGVGTVRGPYFRNGSEGRYKAVTHWGCGGDDAIELLQIMLPWLGERRSERAREAIAARTTLRNRVRPQDTHCIRGHEFTLENTFKKNDGDGRGCLTCRRIAGQKYRDKKRSERVSSQPIETAVSPSRSAISSWVARR